MKLVHKLAAVFLLVCGPSFANAQAKYPSQPIRLILPAPAAGYYDRVARILAMHLAQSLGQPVVVENKEGANGAIGAALVARAAPDGYTLIMGAIGPFGIAPSLSSKLPYDAVRDFSPIALVTTMPSLLLVNANSTFKSTKDFVGTVKSRSASTLYGNFGVGTSSHLAMERFKTATATNLEGVAYKGSAPAILALANGEVEVAFGNVQDALPFIRSGKIRALAVAAKNRTGALPDVPTLAEGGVTNVESSNWIGLLAPAKTPPAIIERLNVEVNKILRDPEVRKKLAPSSELEVLGGTPVQFQQYIGSEISRWSEVVKTGNIQKD
ncbi:MAG: tripartite tricarboxylate transporter substrate binding protein [Polaromonas sp.]|uniref:Bug family tripartite tricarboxylate transporter substrate binding protein n=1 Tax=Polaromonas sp. TaxID=1869339 RepID=UPI0025FA328F|nr:tripartite tricarboxylate transporter substrate binding protein [Polaromonas sp.]MBI2726536.1 tripartite tricarboxylate transporter substrate binding protein [Polaromonas sp.]